jgi:hypothetical protein
MSTDQEFWEQVAAPTARVLLQTALTKIEVGRAIAVQGESGPQFAAEMAAELADRLLIERNKRIVGLEGLEVPEEVEA